MCSRQQYLERNVEAAGLTSSSKLDTTVQMVHIFKTDNVTISATRATATAFQLRGPDKDCFEPARKRSRPTDSAQTTACNPGEASES